MTVEGCSRVAKYILVGFNVLVLIAGGLAIGLGAWTLASDYGADKLRDITGSNLYRGAAIAIIVGGCIIVILAFLGCCGSLMENRIMLSIYFVIMLLFLILFVVAAVLGFVYKDDLKDELAKKMESTLTTKYGTNLANSEENRATTDVWDDVQKNLQCCGVQGGLSSDKSWFLWQSSEWYKNQSSVLLIARNLVPESCCNPNFDKKKCQTINSDINSPVQVYHNVTTENSALYSKGCIDRLMDEVDDHIAAIAGVAVAVLVVLLLSVIFSVCVCTSIGKDSMVV
ncbi:hypothetical protein BsWGS_19432 [Bradybaena similaris]